MAARKLGAQGAGVACALWASSSWGQAPPADAPAPAAEPPAPAPGAEAAPAVPPAPAEPAPADPGVGASPVAAPNVVDAPAAEAVGPIEDVGQPDNLDEVVVTVDRRKKNLQDYSGTAAAFSEAQLTNIGVTQVSQLSMLVPGLQIGQAAESTLIYIRGVGSDNATELGDPAVAVHVDNVYLPRFRGLNTAWLDVQRVEVNSGPQGTIRGRNAVGGSINIISKPAVFGEYQANAEVTYGSYRQRAYTGMLNIPFGEDVALRLAGTSKSVDPTWRNVGPIVHLPGASDANEYAGKGQLRIRPTRKLDVVLAGDYNLQRGAGFGGANVIGLLNNMNDNGTVNDQSDDFLDPIDVNDLDDPRRVWQRGRYPQTWTEHSGGRLDVNYDAGPFTIELLGSFRYLDWLTLGGANAGYFADGTNLVAQQWDAWSFSSQQHNDSKSMVGELRFASRDDQRLVWSVGLFGFHEDQGAFLGQITGDPDGGFNEFNMPSTIEWSVAAYGDATFKVNDNLRLLAGLRYSREHKDRLGGVWMIGSDLGNVGNTLCARQNAAGECVEFGLASNDIGRFGTEGFRFKGLDRKNYTVPGPDATTEDRVNFFLDGIESFGVRDQTAIALCNDPEPITTTLADGTTNTNTTTRLIQVDGNWRCQAGVRPEVDAAPNNFTNVRPQNGERDDHYFDFRLGVEYDLVKDSMLYATVSSGHKAGGFNDSLPNPDVMNDFITPDYGPETDYALEIGSKNLLADRKLRLNAAAFAFLYQGMQFQTIITVGEAPPLNADGSVQFNPDTPGMRYPDNRGGSAARQNAKDTSTAYGLDLDAVYALPAGMEVDLHALFMDARFPDHTYVNDGRLGLGAAPAQVDIGGYWLPRVSPFTLNYSLSQLIFTEAGSFDWIIQGQTRGQHFMTPYNGNGTRFAPRGPGWGIDATGNPAPIEVDTNPQYEVLTRNLQRFDDRVPTYTVFNVGVGWKRTDGLLSIRGFVNNVFDVTYATNIGSTSGNNNRNFNDPRMAGVRVRMDF
ncbi:MAG: TonB-dependent receptor [Deltaproteobacteria bacterium]